MSAGTRVELNLVADPCQREELRAKHWVLSTCSQPGGRGLGIFKHYGGLDISTINIDPILTRYTPFSLYRSKIYYNIKVNVFNNIYKFMQIQIPNKTYHNFQSHWHISRPQRNLENTSEFWKSLSGKLRLDLLLFSYILQLGSWFKQRQNFSITESTESRFVTWS